MGIDKGRMTIESLDRIDTLPGLDIERRDFRVLMGFLFVGLITGAAAGSFLNFVLLAPVGALLGLAAGVVLMIAKPSPMVSTEFVATVKTHLKAPNRLKSKGEVESEESESRLSPLTTNVSTKDHVPINRYFHEKGAVERDDGKVVGAIQLFPQSMDFASDEDYYQIARQIAQNANNELNFKVQLKITTREFPIDEHLSHLREQSNTEDIKTSPAGKAVLDDRLEERESELENKTIAPCQFYYVVEIGDKQVATSSIDNEATGLGKLAQIPVLGILFSAFEAKTRDVSEDDILDRKISELNRGLGKIEQAVSGIEGAGTSRLTTPELLALTKETFTSDSITDPHQVTPAKGGIIGRESSSEEVDTDAEDPALQDERESHESEVHQAQLAPDPIEREWEMIKVGDEYRQGVYVETFPGGLEPGALRTLFTEADLKFDLGLHLDPIDRRKGIDKAEKRIRSISSESELEEEDVDIEDRLGDLGIAKLCRQAMKEGERPFEISLYVVVYGEEKEAVHRQAERVASILRDRPAQMGPKVLRGMDQVHALKAVAPLAYDAVAEEGSFDPTSITLGHGVGSLMASPKDNMRLDASGIELGTHSANDTPVSFDQFDTETNYNWTVVADSGSGKSYWMKQTAVRTWLNRDDTRLIFIDPLQNFEGVAHAMGARKIRVGGGQKINPLELQQVADHTDSNTDPLSETIKDVLSFLDNYAYQQGIETGLQGEARALAAEALKTAYNNRGITRDPATHHRDPPTMSELNDVLGDMSENPGDYTLRTDSEMGDIKELANSLLNLLRPFENGQYENLNGQSDFHIGDNEVTYLDLSQGEGSKGGPDGLMMQLVFSEVYEAAKQTDDNVIVYIDEARYFMRDTKNLEFLGQRVRHSRHHDTSIRFITQNVRDFRDHPEAESIINNTAVNAFLRTKEIAEWQDLFDLNDLEVRFIEEAAAGKNQGYSQALVDIEGRTYPLDIQSTSLEHEVIDFSVRDDELASLPGIEEEENPLVREIRCALEQEAAHFRQELTEEKRANYLEAWQNLSRRARGFSSLLSDPELFDVLETIVSTNEDPDQVLGREVRSKIEAMFGSGYLSTQNIEQVFDEEGDDSPIIEDPLSPDTSSGDGGDGLDALLGDSTDTESQTAGHTGGAGDNPLDADTRTDPDQQAGSGPEEGKSDPFAGLMESSDPEGSEASPIDEETESEETFINGDSDVEEGAEDSTRSNSLTDRRDVFKRALEIDRSDLSDQAKDEQLNELFEEARSKDISIEAQEIGAAIELDRKADRADIAVSVDDIIHGVEDDLSVDDIQEAIESFQPEEGSHDGFPAPEQPDSPQYSENGHSKT